ncbi:trafficking kinesin-binding protein milt-like isoform X3 [Chironomus tepperi]|uniref:trafficking kinesin-binding protein milt-like isoform X3 n=2 Tax=Chironomus tepperi TaxID=113505 RepID=UPI00391EE76C
MKMCKNTDNDRFLSMFSPNVKATLEKHSIGVPQSLSYLPKQYNDASTVTDLCSSDADEVEIFSLIEEQIPKYKVRACKITNFSGTSNQDFEFVKFPALNVPENIGLGLTSDQIRETLNYFLLSGKRCSEMTTCYDDIEAVTRLLQEKEKDLELTVHIGKELLSQNTQLEKRILELEGELRGANESISQLSHELVQKTELINILTENEEVLTENASPSSSKLVNIELIQRKINVLEKENKKLHSEVLQVQEAADEIEEHEKRLMQDLSEQLNLTNSQYEGLNLELERYKEENRLQNEQIANLSQRLSDAEYRLHELLTENEEAYITLSVTKENQNLLASELSECKSRYQETLTLLQEAQLLLREKQRRSQPQSNRSSLYVPGGIQVIPQYNPESLATELMESSMFSENSSLDSGINSDHGHNKQVPQFQKVFETVKCAGNNTFTGFGDSLASELNILSSQPRMSSSVYSTDSINKSNMDKIPSFSMYSSIYGSQKNDEAASTVSDDYNSHRQFGMMGCPGAQDLETALKNLSSAEIIKRRTELSYGTYNYENETAMTPESVFSNMSASTGSSMSYYRYPKKLEIVKPLEGSITLNQWKGLATPTLDGLLHDNERVKVRGEKGLDEFGLQIYCLGDVEEDVEELPSLKHFEPSSCIYTYTDSKVLHHDDGASITFSLPPSRMSTAPPTPRIGLSRRNSCSTFSVSNGLASMLNERGISAVTPSCLNTPSGPNFSPTLTPCNSPECQSPTLESQEAHNSVSLTSFLSTSAGLLKKKITRQNNNKSNTNNQETDKAAIILEQKVKQRTINLLKEVDTLGIENILPAISSSSSLSSGSRLINKPLALHSSNIYTTRYSPMTQLTSLKHLSDNRRKCNESSSESDKKSNVSASSSTNNNNNNNSSSPEARIKQKLQRHKTRRNLNAVQRPDLGTVNGTKAADKPKDTQSKPGIVGGFVGSISSIFFGRKGGFL